MAVEVLTDNDFSSTIKEEDKVIVKYFAGWCGSCRLFAPKFKRLSGDERFSDIKFVDVDAENNPEARKLAGVTNLPFFAVFKKGELLGTVSTSKEEGVLELLSQLN
ncbi:thioredoxin family protein [Fulvivirga sediminis]|uniref:Thioredoxin family protein n=1 Tax=Fulvivirga sediminis TaxID=2803949 RepID=A0A937F955_9BACT|nr:thioredoxin family protein [Fulvivirga sediminis]MBL3657307.1 thioredoxin family protein [Fulvivirga sediminis]